jgi:MYXO-CTERM domain-containing protein
MTPYMQPYIDASMVFVAAKLIPGADLDELRPLKMTYPGVTPMIPLQLTAIAADPHLTVTSFIYGDSYFRPMGHPLVTIDESKISEDILGRRNYPMVLARAVDDAGGDGFVVEYARNAPYFQISGDSSCCDGYGDDFCDIGGDNLCQCPGADFDMSDCETIPGLLEGVGLMNQLAEQHSYLTRLTTRVSAHEMTFDPMFEATPENPGQNNGALIVTGQRNTLDACSSAVIDTEEYAAIEALQGCAAIYCGPGTCAATSEGAGCSCDAGTTAQVFLDLDGERSVTCVPNQHTVDLSAGGVDLPDACASVSCGMGSCLEIGGFATCACDPGNAAVVQEGSGTPVCASIQASSGSPGAEDFSAPMSDIEVCRPLPPLCPDEGWYEANPLLKIQGVNCDDWTPSADQLTVPPAPTCDGETSAGPSTDSDESDSDTSPSTGQDDEGCGCATKPRDPLGWLHLALLGPLLLLRRRR